MRILILTALIGLTACSTGRREELPPPQLPQRAGVDATVAAGAEGIEFRATGEGFVLDIFGTERIRLTLTGADEPIVFPKPEPRYPAWNGMIYETTDGGRRLIIEVRNFSRCPSGEPTVQLTLDGRAFTGCGQSF